MSATFYENLIFYIKFPQKIEWKFEMRNKKSETIRKWKLNQFQR